MYDVSIIMLKEQLWYRG